MKLLTGTTATNKNRNNRGKEIGIPHPLACFFERGDLFESSTYHTDYPYYFCISKRLCHRRTGKESCCFRYRRCAE